MISRMMDTKRKAVLTTTIFLVLTLVSTMWATPAQAITWGQEDKDNNYPNVGTIVAELADSGELVLVCSGTLISTTVFLTAGHCTSMLEWACDQGIVSKLYVSFDFNPFEKRAKLHAVSGVITHPDYNDLLGYNDVGILILSKPVHKIKSAKLAPVGFLDDLRNNGELGQGTTFTAVGYGVNLTWPPPVISYPDTRSYTESGFQALLGRWLLLSQNNARNNGGTGPGDSGGPIFWEDNDERILVGITSWGDPNCIAIGFNTRVDIPDTLDFINQYV